MSARRSPMTGRKRQTNFQSPRPYSMFAGSQYLKTHHPNIDSFRGATNLSGISLSTEQGSPTNTQYIKSGKSKRNSSLANESLQIADNLSGGLQIVDVNANSTAPEFVNSSPYGGKKKSSSPQKRIMPPAGPSPRTWQSPKSVKRLPTSGHVFGTYVSKSGLCYVSVITPKGERLIQSFDRSGVLVKSFQPRAGGKVGRVFEPFQMCEMLNGSLVLASGTSVTVWSKEGKLLNEHGKNMFKFAKSVAVRSTDEIVVADCDNDSVKIISPNGQQINQLDCEFHCPVGVAVDSDDHIIVVDWKDQIRIFDEDNKLIKTFGTKGCKDGEVDLPYGVTVDCENNLVISDMWNNRVSLYTQEGQFLRNILPDSNSHSVRLPAFVSVTRGETAEDYRMAVTNYLATAAYLFTY